LRKAAPAGLPAHFTTSVPFEKNQWKQGDTDFAMATRSRAAIRGQIR